MDHEEKVRNIDDIKIVTLKTMDVASRLLMEEKRSVMGK